MSAERPYRYLLDAQGEPYAEADLTKWAVELWRDPRRVLAKEEVGPFHVSTVFLGIDHNYRDEGPPILFETMIFGPDGHELSDSQWRYSSRRAALAGHAAALEQARDAAKSLEAPQTP